jgi:hypothetical protein
VSEKAGLYIVLWTDDSLPDDEEGEDYIDPRPIKPVPDPLAVDPKYKFGLFLVFGGGLFFLFVALSSYLTR